MGFTRKTYGPLKKLHVVQAFVAGHFLLPEKKNGMPSANLRIMYVCRIFENEEFHSGERLLSFIATLVDTDSYVFW